MGRGRPKITGKDICPNCRKLGYPYPKHVSKNSAEDMYLYPWFKHNDGSPPCDIGNTIKKADKVDSQIVEEYGREGQKGTDFRYYSKPRNQVLKKLPLKEVHENKTSRVAIYTLQKNNGKDIRKKLDQLKNADTSILELKELEVFLRNSKKIGEAASQFLEGMKDFLKDSEREIVITYGVNAWKDADSFDSKTKITGLEITYLTDKYGILNKLQEKKLAKEKQVEIYNYPPRTLPDLISPD